MNWNILSNKKPDNEDEVIKILLGNRGIKTQKEISEFLSPTNPADFTAKDLGIDEKEIKKAIDRIKKAIDNNEGIIVYGDYDADGICATAILWETLYKLTKNVLPYIPERVSEGYGLNCDSIQNLKFTFRRNSSMQAIKNLKLIITVDHGITADEKIKFAKELGIDVIVCDHHQLSGQKPECSAVVHTDEVCAATIAWFLGGETVKKLPDRQFKPIPYRLAPVMINTYLDLVAIATIADLEPLVGVNRSFAKYGLEELRRTKRCGLLAIFEEAGVKKEKIDTYHVGYIIAPRLNAMGRMEHALESLRLLCTSNCEKAKDLADKLGLTNKERQLLTEETVKQAKLLVAGLEGKLPKFLVVDSDQYEEGVIGLVAGKLVEEFHRPAVVVSRGETYSKASARSINGFNIIEAIRAHSDLLVDAGGHPMAAGFTIETAKLEIFREKLVRDAEEQIPPELLEKTLKIDLELSLGAVSLALWEKIRKLAPFGIGNPEPSFNSEAVIKEFRTVGSEGKHLKLSLALLPNSPNFPARQASQPAGVAGRPNFPYCFPAIAFNQGYLAEQLKIDQEVKLAYNLSLNEWNNQKNIELKIRDLKPIASKN